MNFSKVNKKKIMFCVSSPFALNYFLLPHIMHIGLDFEIHICVNSNLYPVDPILKKVATIYDVPIQRKISIIKDLIALMTLIWIFLKVRPFLVQSITHKAGLLAMFASWLCFIPNRWHTFTGQYWENRVGLYRHLLKNADRAISFFSSKLFADSYSQVSFLKSENITFAKNITVLGDGSIAGVDTEKFKFQIKKRKLLRRNFNVCETKIIFLFVGRLAKEKGIFDLSYAYERLLALKKGTLNSELWFVGPDDQSIIDQLKAVNLHAKGQVKFFAETINPENYMIAADVLCLPSYREGFGSVVIEAAACGIPAIGYMTNGLTDSVVNESTGILVNYKSIEAFSEAMLELLTNHNKRRSLGLNARKYALEKFNRKKITSLYKDLIFNLADSGKFD